MKKIVKVLALSFAVIAFAAACNNTPAETEDTTAVDTPEVIDTPVVDTIADTVAVVEEPAAPAKKTAKKATKKLNETQKVQSDGAIITSNNAGKMKKANGALDNETSKTDKSGNTVSTMNTGKMKKKTSEN